MDDKHEPHVIPFATRTGRGSGNGHGGEPPPENDELVEPGNAYAAVRGVKSPPALKFLRHDGSLLFAMPYGLLPIVWGESPELVLLEYPGFHTVILAGWNLATLEARLCEYRVTWIRACDASYAAGLTTAVTRIERMHRYPSRELSGTASDK